MEGTSRLLEWLRQGVVPAEAAVRWPENAVTMQNIGGKELTLRRADLATGELVRLVELRFAQEAHGPTPGLGLAYGYLNLDRVDDAQVMRRRLRALNAPSMTGQVASLIEAAED